MEAKKEKPYDEFGNCGIGSRTVDVDGQQTEVQPREGAIPDPWVKHRWRDSGSPRGADSHSLSGSFGSSRLCGGGSISSSDNSKGPRTTQGARASMGACVRGLTITPERDVSLPYIFWPIRRLPCREFRSHAVGATR